MSLLSFLNAETQAPAYLIKDFLPAASVVYFSGPRKRGFKTFSQKFITAIAATGQPYTAGNWQTKKDGSRILMKGAPVTLVPTKPCRILSYQQEGTVLGNKSRLVNLGIGLNQWTAANVTFEPNSLGHDDYKIINVDPTNPFVENFHFFHRSQRVGFSALNFHNAQKMAALHEAITLIKPDIVVLDAITYMHNGKENDPENMLVMVKGLFSIRDRGITVIGVMHTSKDGQKNTELRDIDLDLRGHSSQLDAYDAHFGFRRWSPAGSGYIDLICRYRERPETTYKVHWEIPQPGIIGPIKLNMVRVTEEA